MSTCKSMPELFEEAFGKELEYGVFSVHGTEIKKFYKLIVEDQLADRAAMIGVLMQDIWNDIPVNVQLRLSEEMGRTHKRIRTLEE